MLAHAWGREGVGPRKALLYVVAGVKKQRGHIFLCPLSQPHLSPELVGNKRHSWPATKGHHTTRNKRNSLGEQWTRLLAGLGLHKPSRRHTIPSKRGGPRGMRPWWRPSGTRLQHELGNVVYPGSKGTQETLETRKADKLAETGTTLEPFPG